MVTAARVGPLGDLGFSMILVDGAATPTSYRYVPLPKSATPVRIQSNTWLYDFSLDDGDMRRLDALDQGKAGAVTWNPVDAE